MSVIEVKNLKKYFGKTKAVDDISFSVEKGEIFGFLGPNGAGKTTTIRCMMDFLRPDSGSISILEKDSKKDGVELKHKIGYLSGQIRLYPKWTGWDHIKFISNLNGSSGKAEELIKRFDFNPNLKCKNLSSGNIQKLGIIMAFMTEPEILILDEPTLALDPLLQNEIYDLLSESVNRGATIFMSSHNLAEVERVCSRVGIIKQGKMVATENITSLKQKKIYEVRVHFTDQYSKEDFNIEGVSIERELPDGLILDVKGDISPLIKKISNYNLKDIDIERAPLEDIFMEFYERE